MFSTATLSLLLAAGVNLASAAVTAPIYYLANCYAYPYDASYNAVEYGAIGYYAHLVSLPSTPSKISVLHVGDLVSTSTPFHRAPCFSLTELQC